MKPMFIDWVNCWSKAIIERKIGKLDKVRMKVEMDGKVAVTHALFLAVLPKRSLRFRRCLGNGGGISYALAESLDFATPKICERNLRYRRSALAEPAW